MTTMCTNSYRRNLVESVLLVCILIISEGTHAFQAPLAFKSPNRLVSSLDNSRETQYESPPKSYTIEVTHQNKSTKLQIYDDETILQALERAKIHDKLALPSFPNECRRGNCLTCSGRLKCDSKGDEQQAIKKVEIRKDGLSPTVSRSIKEKGIVPTCSTFVVGDGVHFELGVCDDVWREVYANDDAEGERIRNDAVAKAMRLADEKNLNRWAAKTERMLQKDDGILE